MRTKLAILFLLLGTAAFASGGGEGGTDILPRAVNFLIFAGIIYYLLADHVKNFFQGRKASIAAELENVQVKLKEAKEEKKRAEKELENAKKFAEEIIETAKKESVILAEKIRNQFENEIASLEKMHNEQCELEKRKMIRGVVKEVLDELLDEKNLPINEKEFVNLIVKKVA
ncbi:F0F1 ATP synthase subunit B [Nitrosophilus alvini]|uniref:F0F1 ATP synthase subunit B n=1 Tax=Nitrosophilus alvini TaxID=2714855 RepID=UPI00190A27C2|nr:F0F1 ATP synthase subunit B [Nitrosophilus alvini]